MNAILALFSFTLRQSLRDLKFWLVVAVLLLPCVIIGLIRYFGPVPKVTQAWMLYHGLVQFMLLMGMIPLVSMIYGSGLIGAEVESRTICYLITRTLRRRTVLVTRFAAVFLVLTVTCYAALGALHVCVLAGQPWASSMFASIKDWNMARDLGVYLAIIPLAVAGFLAIFTLIGLVATKPLALSLAYYVLFELVLGNVPAAVSRYSVVRQLRGWVVDRIPELTQMNPELFVADVGGLWNILIVTIAALILACVCIGRRELVPHKVARD
jgi:ABC-type transport system involved in multi-copper enzyme maturation permease subunit